MYDRIAEVYDAVLTEDVHDTWTRFVHEAWQDDPDGVRSVLDVCCGTGLMAERLSALGYRVVGVDGSATMVARARERLGPDVALAVASLPELPVPGGFDAAVSSFDSLNYVQLDVFAQSLLAVAGRLRPGGWFVFDAHTEPMMRTIAAAPQAVGHEGGSAFRIDSVVDLDARTCDSRVEIVPDDGSEPVVEEHRQYFFSEAEIRGALAAAGLTVVSLTDEYSAAPVDALTLRGTWVVRRNSPAVPPVPEGNRQPGE